MGYFSFNIWFFEIMIFFVVKYCEEDFFKMLYFFNNVYELVKKLNNMLVKVFYEFLRLFIIVLKSI